MTIELVKSLIIENFFSKNGNINPSISNLDIINDKDLIKLMNNIKFYTSFLPETEKIKFRVYCILNDIKEFPKCKCGKDITKINQNSKIFNLYCSQKCANRYSNYEKSSEFYKEVAKNIVKTRRKNNSYVPTDAFKNYLKDKENYAKFKEKCKEKYGVENPGVLGAYSSKIAEKYIRQYILDNNIDENKCYFKNGGINNKEYFLTYKDEEKNKNIFFSYDLVIINDNKDIIYVFET